MISRADREAHEGVGGSVKAVAPSSIAVEDRLVPVLALPGLALGEGVSAVAVGGVRPPRVNAARLSNSFL